MCVGFPRALRQRLLSKRSEEEAKLNEESDGMLAELRKSFQEEKERQQHKLRSDFDTWTTAVQEQQLSKLRYRLFI